MTNQKQNLRALVFDMDGTLFDSSSVVPDAYIATVVQRGGPQHQRQDIINRYSLGPPRVILSDLLARHCRDADIETYYSELEKRAKDVIVYEGVRECLSALKAVHLPLGVFSGASFRACVTLLDAAQLSSYFAVLVGGDQVQRPKPEGDGIVLACSRLGVPTNAAGYVGDAPLDLEAARRAGTVALAAGWGHQFGPDAGADLVLTRPSDVLPLVVS